MMAKNTRMKRLYIDLQSGSGYAFASIALHRNVTHVIVRKSPSFLETAPTSQSRDLAAIEAIAAMEHLTRLDFVDFENGNLPISGLAIIMKKARMLETLRLDSVDISGTKEEFAEFVKELQGHSSLAEIHLYGCLPSTETRMIQAMAEALASLKSLRVVEIVETRFSPFGSWSGLALATLCQSHYLKAIRIRGVHFLRENHIVLAARALEDNQVLEELNLLCDIEERAVHALCQMLQINRTLRILCMNRIMKGVQASEIAEALGSNTSLRELHLYFRCCVIRDLRTSFLGLMETNYTLEKVAGGWACPNIDLFLKLNRAGRKRLLKANNPSKTKWVDVMASQQDDIQSLYYLLSQNPALCHDD